MEERVFDHVRKWQEVMRPATMETIINALLLIIAELAETAPRIELRDEFLDYLRNFIDHLQDGSVKLKKRELQ